jgi:hypothetical protein
VSRANGNVLTGAAPPQFWTRHRPRQRKAAATVVATAGIRAHDPRVNSQLRSLRGILGLPIERDEHFEADKTISAYAAEARQHGRIVT